MARSTPPAVHVRVDAVVLAGVPRGREAAAVRALRRRLDELARLHSADARSAHAESAHATTRPRVELGAAGLGAAAAEALWAAVTAVGRPSTPSNTAGDPRW